MTVRCRDCGNANEQGNKFCKFCGKKLRPDTEGRCPECGAHNPPNKVFCDECGARLTPSPAPAPADSSSVSSVRGLSLPSREPDEDDGAPDWLSQLRAGIKETPPEEPLPAADDEQHELPAAEADAIPAWLRDIAADEPVADRDIVDEESGLSLPAAQSDDPFSPDALGSVAESGEGDWQADGDVPDWLADFSAQSGDPVASEVQSRGDDDGGTVPDWMQAFASQGDEPEISQLPSADEPSGVPDWLAELDVDQPDVPQEDLAPLPAELPDWMEEVEADPLGAPTADDQAETPELPVGDEPFGRSLETESVPDPSAAPDEIPDWLQSFSAGQGQVESEMAPDDDMPGPSPEWLQDAVPDQQTAEQPGIDANFSESLDWLDTLTGESDAPAAAEMETDLAPGKLPDWLQEMAPQEATGAEAVTESELAALSGWQDGGKDEGEIEPGETDPTAAGLPDWLQEMTSQAQGEVSEAIEPEPPAIAESLPALESEPGQDEIPSWLDEAVPEQPDALPEWLHDVEAADESPAVHRGEMPSWLDDADQDRAAADTSAESPTTFDGTVDSFEFTTPEDTEQSDLSGGDWLEQASPAGDIGTAQTRSLVGTGPLVPPELPDWLAAVGDEPSAELPDWLMQDDIGGDQFLSDETLAPVTPAPDEPDEPGASPLPSWLAPQDASMAAVPEADLDDQVSDISTADLPDWLQPQVSQRDEVVLEPGELPDWLLAAKEGSQEQMPVPKKGAGVASDAFEFGPGPELVQAEIPDWLQALKPSPSLADALGAEKDAGLEPVEKGGLLDGLRGALTAESAVSLQPVSKELPGFVIGEQQQRHAQLLNRIVTAGPAPLPDTVSRAKTRSWLERTVIPFLILAALFVTALVEIPLPFSSDEAPTPQVIRDTYNLVQILPESALTVVAFDYSPAEAGELDVLATVMLRHLMARHARLLLVSTSPAGAEIAQQAVDTLAPEYEYQYAQDYLNLGYIPGGAVGLLSFAANPWQQFPTSDFMGEMPVVRDAPAAAGMTDSLAEADLVLFLTADRADLINWIEQVGRLVDVDMVAGVSAALEPWAQPYFHSSPRQLNGMLNGVPGAVAYENLLGEAGGATAAGLQDGTLGGLIIVLAFVAIGLLWGTVQGLINRRQGNG